MELVRCEVETLQLLLMPLDAAPQLVHEQIFIDEINDEWSDRISRRSSI